MNFLFIISFLFYVSLASTSIINYNNVRAIAVLFRHGERTPSTTYPNDPYIEHFDKIGWGKLTSVGCQRAFAFGKFLGAQYPQIKYRSSTQLRSSAASRCIDSVKCFMHGLNSAIHRIPRRFKARSIPPIESLPLDADPILNHASIKCPVRERATKTDPKIVSLKTEYKTLFDNLTRATGEVYNDAYFAIGQRFDPIKIEVQMGLKMPNWVTPEFLNDSVTIHDKLFGILGELDIEQKLSGTFLQDLTYNLTSSPRERLSLFVYGSHDTTLAPIMATLDMWQGKRPKNGEGLVFTLTNDDQLSMFYYHQNNTLSQWAPPGCAGCCENCSLQNFRSGVDKFIPQDWREECKLAR